jgi:hypothetical protein
MRRIGIVPVRTLGIPRWLEPTGLHRRFAIAHQIMPPGLAVKDMMPAGFPMDEMMSGCCLVPEVMAMMAPRLRGLSQHQRRGRDGDRQCCQFHF